MVQSYHQMTISQIIRHKDPGTYPLEININQKTLGPSRTAEKGKISTPLPRWMLSRRRRTTLNWTRLKKLKRRHWIVRLQNIQQIILIHTPKILFLVAQLRVLLPLEATDPQILGKVSKKRLLKVLWVK